MANNFGSSNDRSGNIPKVTSDFQCFVCEAIFTTYEDRRNHLEKEYHGEQRDDTTEEEMEIARRQEKIQKNYQHSL
jgi:hypothetical protein